jgi:hypothetical protein
MNLYNGAAMVHEKHLMIPTESRTAEWESVRANKFALISVLASELTSHDGTCPICKSNIKINAYL